MKKPKISVIMGVYNADEKLLALAINSILTQTFQDFEFIICDDASNNGTSLWLRQYAARDKRIRIITHKENKRLATSLNDCIKVAQGDFLARQDADDISDPTRFEKQLRFLDKYPKIDFVGSNCALYAPDKGVFDQRFMPEFPQPRDFLFNSPFIHGSLMFRRSCLNTSCCYRVCRWTNRTEDYDLFMDMYSKNFRGANLQENLYTYCYSTDQHRIAMNYRVDEMVIRYNGFRKMGLLPKGFPYVVKPVMLGAMPHQVVSLLRDIHNHLASPV